MNHLIMYFNELTNCIVMTIYGILAGHYDVENIAYFLKLNEQYFINELNLENGTPSSDTLIRIYSLIKPNEFMDLFVSWVKNIIDTKNKSLGNKYKLLPIVGKAIKSATDKINVGNIPYVISAFLFDLGISIGQIKVDNKSNQISDIPDLLDLIDISNCVITIDAIRCQKNIIQKIIDKNGHYCISVKSKNIIYTN